MSSDEDDIDGVDGSGVLTNLLFGNVNSEGALEDDIFDESARKSLHQLSHLGMGNLVSELAEECTDEQQSDYKQGEKDATAVDYSDETELAEEQEGQPDSAPKIPVAKQEAPTEEVRETQPGSTSPQLDSRIHTPLALMLPEKYRNVDVTQLFPHFKSGKVLRFSKLFGPGKPNSLPQIWRGVKRRKKKRKYEDSTIDQDKRIVELDLLEEVPPELIEPSEALTLDSDQDKDKDKKDRKDDEDKNSGDSGQPVAADFRFGPAQLWYDMFAINENGDSLDYGFRLISDEERQDVEKYPHLKQYEPSKEEKDVPEDAFLMVTQLHWEDDIIWSAEEVWIRSKMLTRKVHDLNLEFLDPTCK